MRKIQVMQSYKTNAQRIKYGTVYWQKTLCLMIYSLW